MFMVEGCGVENKMNKIINSILVIGLILMNAMALSYACFLGYDFIALLIGFSIGCLFATLALALEARWKL